MKMPEGGNQKPRHATNWNEKHKSQRVKAFAEQQKPPSISQSLLRPAGEPHKRRPQNSNPHGNQHGLPPYHKLEQPPDRLLLKISCLIKLAAMKTEREKNTAKPVRAGDSNTDSLR
jgi:hypothetical protein